MQTEELNSRFETVIRPRRTKQIPITQIQNLKPITLLAKRRLASKIKQGILILFVLVNFLSASFTQDNEVFVFYSPDCRHCKYMLNTFLPKIRNDYGVMINLFDVEIAKNLYYLEKLEEGVKDVGDELPAVFFRDSVIYGSDAVFKRLGEIIAGYLVQARVHVTYFTKTGCRECNRVDNVIKVLTRVHKNVIIHTYNNNIKENRLLAEAISEQLGVPQNKRLIAPTLFFGNDYLVKSEISLTRLEELLKKYPFGTADFESLNPEIKAQSERLIQERFASIGILGIVSAGLIDGVNPCAFATIVFFISYLVFLGRRKRDVLLMGLFFTLAVFLSYFAIGLGFFEILNFVTQFRIISRLIFIGFGVVAMILGCLSLYDFFKARAGKANEMKLQLPDLVKVKIHESIKTKTKALGICLGAFIAGIFISLFEFICTGQVYLPTITYVVSNPALKVRAVTMLLLYNISFIVPLISITVLGVVFTSQKVGQALKSRIGMIKLFTAFLFFALGFLLMFFSR